MTRDHARDLMRRHGLACLLGGLLAGFVLTAAMIGGLSASPLPLFIKLWVPGSIRGWLSVHLGMVLNGLMALVLGGVLADLELSGARRAICAWGVLVAIWGNALFYVFSMFAPNHGLTADANALGLASWASQLAYYPAVIGAVALMVSVTLMISAKNMK